MESTGLYSRLQITEEKYMFSENLKTLRTKKGYTQENLAIKINVVRQTVSKWEKGLSVPDAQCLVIRRVIAKSILRRKRF